MQAGHTAFIPSRSQVSRIIKNFEACGLQFELIFCQLAWRAGEESRLNAYARTDEQLQEASFTYGLDVSWPSCNHSAILQPGVVPTSPAWRQKLNQYGLLNDFEEAAKLRSEYLAMYPYPPFDIYLVHKIERKGSGKDRAEWSSLV